MLLLGVLLALPLPLLSQAGDPERAAMLDRQGMEAYKRGTGDDLREALNLWTEAAELYERAGQLTEAGTLLNNAGYLHMSLGAPLPALAHYSAALVIWRQEGDRLGEASTLANIGNVWVRLAQPDSALVVYARALAIQRELKDRSGEGITVGGIGSVYENLGRWHSALAFYEQSLAILKEVGNRSEEATILNNLGNVSGELGQLDTALIYFGQALAILRDLQDRSREGMILSNLGAVHNLLGRPDSASSYYRRALSILRQAGNRTGEGATLNRIGNLHNGRGQPDSALVNYADALAIWRDLGDLSAIGMTLGNIGTIYAHVGQRDSALYYFSQGLVAVRAARHRSEEGSMLGRIATFHAGLGQLDSALVYHGHALTIRREVEDRFGEATTLSAIANVQIQLGRPQSALAYYSQALAIQQTWGHRSGEGVTLSGIGLAHADLGQPDSALTYYGRALAIQRLVGDRSAEGGTLTSIGDFHARSGRPDSALVYFTRSLAIRREVRDRPGEGLTLSLLGLLHHADSSDGHLGHATAYYDSAAAVLAQLGAHAGGDQNRLRVTEQHVEMFDAWTLAALARAPELGERVAALTALAASERGRSQALLELMRKSAGETGLRLATPGSDLAAESEKLLRSAVAGGASVLTYLITRDTLLAWLVGPGGDIHLHRTPISRDSVAAAVHALRAALTVGGAAVATRSALLIEEVPDQRFGFGVSGIDVSSAWRTARDELSALLLPPALLNELPASIELVVVPHGALHLVPFAILSLPSGEFLGARKALRYAPSLSTLAEASPRSQTVATDGALVVGNPTMPHVTRHTGERAQLAPLPGAAAEGEWVAKRLGTTALSDSQATESAVRARLPSASVIHLATHGYAYSSEDRARDSFVAFAPDAQRDGLLTVGEVLDELPTLSADLVVLSACQTGVGDVRQAEGTVGLQRAFMARGARSVLVSLWSVDDEATEQLMRHFYEHWQDHGLGKAEALQRAQDDIRSDPERPEWAHPRYWAAFQMAGAP